MYQLEIKKPKWLQLNRTKYVDCEVVKKNKSTSIVYVPQLKKQLTVKNHKLIKKEQQNG